MARMVYSSVEMFFALRAIPKKESAFVYLGNTFVFFCNVSALSAVFSSVEQQVTAQLIPSGCCGTSQFRDVRTILYYFMVLRSAAIILSHDKLNNVKWTRQVSRKLVVQTMSNPDATYYIYHPTHY